MLSLLKPWMRIFLYSLFGLCLNGKCSVSSNGKTIQKCGNVFITVSSLRGSLIELNWNINCKPSDDLPKTIALYDTDIRNKSKQDVQLYIEILTENHPSGFFRTKVSFNASDWPADWEYNSTTLGSVGPQNFPFWIVSFSKSNQIIDIKSLQIQPTWMNDNSDKLKSLNIGNLVIPGTHNSGCYGGRKMFKNYILTQDLSIWQQLVSGIRYLDLRVAHHRDGLFWINHDFVKVKKLKLVYDQIKEFVRRSPKEIIIVDFHRFPVPKVWNTKIHEKFINYTLYQLGKYAYSKSGSENPRGPKLEEIWKAGKNIILAYPTKSFTELHPELWEPIPQIWANTVSVKALKLFIDDYLKYERQTMFNALMAELTPRFIDIISHKNNLRTLANIVNPQVTKWVRDEWKEEVNIVTSDYFLGNDLINVAIEINRNR